MLHVIIDGICCRRRLLVSGRPVQPRVVEESVLEGVRLRLMGCSIGNMNVLICHTIAIRRLSAAVNLVHISRNVMGDRGKVLHTVWNSLNIMTN